MAQPLLPLSSPQATEVALTRDQSFQGYVSRGTVLHVRQGHAVLRPASHWLAASVWRAAVPLAAGQVYVVQTSGWITLTSDSGARIACREERQDNSRGEIVAPSTLAQPPHQPPHQPPRQPPGGRLQTLR